MTCLTRREVESLYNKISGFEFKEILISIAKSKNENKKPILDAGRGNPNWTAALPRQAFFTFGQFAVLETQRTWKEEDLAGMPKPQGIAKRLEYFLEDCQDEKVRDFLSAFIDYGVEQLEFDRDFWVYELVNGIIGDHYPFPDRSLIHIEKVVRNYLIQELCQGEKIEGQFNIFSVEGGAAGMCYLFESLVKNHLLHKGDKIALMTPIFTPYLEIPHLPDYCFEVVSIQATPVEVEGVKSMQYTKEALEVLKDPAIKAVFIVNPNNPLSIAMSEGSKADLIKIVKEDRPDLMVITDDVYGTFVPGFRSLVADLPYNTLCIYSLSKYFGVTGWRLGTIMLHEDNVFDELICNLSEADKIELEKRYTSLGRHAEDVTFIDRIVADSRLVALNHTAGLSTPQQVQMAFFCGFALLDQVNRYKEMTREICIRRKKILYEGLERNMLQDPHDACYYTEINLYDWAKEEWGIDYANEMDHHYKCVDFLYELAHHHHVILLAGDGFASSKWSVRVSLANLNDEDYLMIGKAIRQIMNHWKEARH